MFYAVISAEKRPEYVYDQLLRYKDLPSLVGRERNRYLNGDRVDKKLRDRVYYLQDKLASAQMSDVLRGVDTVTEISYELQKAEAEFAKKFPRNIHYTEVSYEDVDKRILIVGAVENVRDGDGNYYMTDFSNYGETVDICAPGGNIYSTVGSISTDYEFFYGTSMASPMVCGAVAYVWSLDTSMTVDEVRSAILEGCTYSAVGIENSADETYPMLNLGEAAKSIMTD